MRLQSWHSGSAASRSLSPWRSGRPVTIGRESSGTRHDGTAPAHWVEVTEVGIFFLPFKPKVVGQLTRSQQPPATQKPQGLRVQVVLQGLSLRGSKEQHNGDKLNRAGELQQ